jgi:hypothetical protein
MTVIGQLQTATVELFGSKESSRIRGQANATELKVRLVVFNAGAMPLQRRSNVHRLILSSRRNPISQKKEEKQMAKLYHVVWEIDINARSPREAAKEAQTIQQDKDSTATIFDVTEENSDKTVRIDLEEGS